MNAHMAVRPSVGGRAPVKPPAQVKEVYSFPLLPLGEIVEVLHELGIVVSEDDLQKPKPDTFRQWCELFVLEILSINKEEIYTPSKAFAAFLGANEELHDDAVPVVHFLRKTCVPKFWWGCAQAVCTRSQTPSRSPAPPPAPLQQQGPLRRAV